MLTTTLLSYASEKITPYKYTTKEREKGLSTYNVPLSSRFTVNRSATYAPDIIYYFTTPPQESFPIAILCGGSSSRNDIGSIVHFHRYFLQEFLDLGAAVLTIEQQGVDGNTINVDEFIEHYTRSERLLDHETVINHLIVHPPVGWNGKFIFLGASEGGPLVTTLTAQYSDMTIATINWAGAWSWREELWSFMKNLKKIIPWYFKVRMCLPRWMPFSIDFSLPHSKKEFDAIMDETMHDPTAKKEFMGMSYKYHADALKKYPKPDYHKIKTPFLVVVGAQDSIIESCDLFVQKAQNADVPITYLRVPGMDHYIRERPDIIIESFEWLKKYI